MAAGRGRVRQRAASGHMLYARRCPSTAYAQNGFALAARTYLCLNRTIERCVCTVC